MCVEFHNRAKEKFFSILKAFEDAISNVSRRKEEYKYQQSKTRYASIMEQELQAIAKDILTKHKDKNRATGIDQMFHQFIRDYLHRFIQKVNAL